LQEPDREMELADKVIVVTGAGHGIGKALCQRFADEKPRGLVVADIDVEAAGELAEQINAQAISCDVSREEEVARLVTETEQSLGPIDLFCSNAGIIFEGGLDLSDDEWRRMLDINFMSHIYAARAVLPGMVSRGGGYLLQTASAAGLLSEFSSAPYAVTKHAVIALAEWLAITYGDKGIRVSCICPQGVKTRMLDTDHPAARGLASTAVDPEEVAEKVIEGLREERFLILPHPEVADFVQRKASDHDRWLDGMRRLRRQVFGTEVG
jgi:NAD(P)-dependent dehydrogenase (short-subunit alcohol dehydrogenase family)